MKQGLLLLLLVVLLLPVCLAGAAVDPLENPQASQAQSVTKEYLIGLPPPREPLDLDSGLRNAPPSRLLREAAEQQAGPLLAELRRLQSQGKILDFSLDPGQFAIRVNTAGELPVLTETGAYAVAAEEGLPACAAGLPQAVTQMARSSVVVNEAMLRESRSATDAPTINISVYAPYVNQYARVSGMTAPDTWVEMRVYRNGSLYLEWYNESYSDGYYEMYPYWDDCPQSGYVWYLQPGDIVEVTAGGETSQTTVVPVVASLDPIAGIIEGRTLPGREIRGWLYTPEPGDCYWNSEEWESDSDANGRFTADVGTVDNLDRRADGQVYVMDAAGHMTYTFFDAFSVNTELGYNGVWATVNRGASGVVRLSRGGQQIAQETFVADETGYASVYFYNNDILPGDVITVQDGKQTISVTMAPADFALDAAQDRLTGTTAPGRTVQSSIYSRDNSYDAVQTTCEFKYGCGTATVPGGGAVTIPAGFDVRPGDYGYVYIYDAEGNTQYGPSLSAPTIVAGLGSPYVRGYWYESYTEVDVRLYDAGNSLKIETSDYTSYQGEIYAWLGQPVALGDRVEISDGVRTLSMVISNVTGRLNSVDDVLTVKGPDRPFLAVFEDYDGPYYNSFGCYESQISGGQKTIDLTGRVSPRDYASVFVRGTDGNYSMLSLNAFTTYVTQGSPEAYFYTETTDVVAAVTHRRGGNSLYQEQLTPDMMGFVWITSGADFIAGDTLEIDVDDGTGATINLTPLTAQVDPANNAVFGVAPADHEAIVRISRQTPNRWWRWGYWTTIGSDGTYRAEFYPDSYWGGGWRQPCLNVRVDDRCAAPSIDYWTSDGHTVTLAYETPPPAPADNFESDDTAATAKSHPGGTRTHTFHTAADVDWVKVTIPAWAVGRPVTFRVFNMGWDVAVDMQLFRPDGTTVVPDQSYSDLGTEIVTVWEPDTAGTVLLRISPMDEYATGHCDSYYDLRLDMAQISLPAILSK